MFSWPVHNTSAVLACAYHLQKGRCLLISKYVCVCVVLCCVVLWCGVCVCVCVCVCVLSVPELEPNSWHNVLPRSRTLSNTPAETSKQTSKFTETAELARKPTIISETNTWCIASQWLLAMQICASWDSQPCNASIDGRFPDSTPAALPYAYEWAALGQPLPCFILNIPHLKTSSPTSSS